MRSTWCTRRAVLASLGALAWVPGCLLAGWWQATVAMAGNSLGYLYAVEWPAFALFGLYLWWHLVHDDPDTVGARGVARLRALAAADAGPAGVSGPAAGSGAARPDDDAAAVAGPATAAAPAATAQAATARRGGHDVPPDEPGEEVDDDLRAYNEYLASLCDRPKTWLA